MLARHEEIRRQKQGAEKSVTVGFPAEKNNKCRNPSHACTPRRNPSPPPAARHVSLCTCADRPPPNLVGSKVLLGYPSGTCSLFVWHQHLRCLKVFCCQQRIPAETSLPSADPRRKTGNSAYLLQLVLSDNYRHVEQEFLFFSALPGLTKELRM